MISEFIIEGKQELFAVSADFETPKISILENNGIKTMDTFPCAEINSMSSAISIQS
jgi:hypothetical protein